MSSIRGDGDAALAGTRERFDPPTEDPAAERDDVPTVREGSAARAVEGESGDPVRTREPAARSEGATEADFFRYESFPPLVEEVELPPEPGPALSAEQLLRRSRLRRGVAAVMAGAALFALAGGTLGALGRRGATGPTARTVQPPSAAGAGALTVREAPDAPPSATLSAKAPPGAPGGAPATPRPRVAAPAAPAPGAAAPADGASLRAEVVRLLEGHELEPAARAAAELIRSEPASAFGYLCLGAARQEEGRWAEALAAYDLCVRTATRGDVSECAALGGRR